MIKSMTAYGNGEYRLGDLLFNAEIRSVNNRYRDIILRMPKSFQPIEKDLKSLISASIKRGRIEASITLENTSEGMLDKMELNQPLAKSYLHIFDQLNQQCGLNQEIRLEFLMQMKDIIVIKPEELEIEKIKPACEKVLNLALDSYDTMRIKEGNAIAADFLHRLKLLKQYVGDVEKRIPDTVKSYQKRLMENIQRITGDISVDQDRIVQEVAIWADRSDITEEMVRIRSHLSQFETYLGLDDALGRRLDFLIQEINREVNTLGSKSADASIGKVVVEMKAELEKIREQVQNIE